MIAVKGFCFVFLVFAICNASASPAKIPSPESPPEQIGSILNKPDARRIILNWILNSQGDSLERIRNDIIASNGNLDQIVATINTNLNKDLVTLDGDVIRANPEEVLRLIREISRNVVASRTNPYLGFIVDANIKNRAEEIKEVVGQVAISADSVREITALTPSRRVRREDGDFNLINIINDAVINLLSGQINNVIIDLLEIPKNILLQFYIVTPSEGLLASIESLVNTAIVSVVEAIANIQNSLKSGQDTANALANRVRRDLTSGNESGSGGGLLDIIFSPILKLVGTILGPINLNIKILIAGVLNGFESILGTKLVSDISKIVFTIINLLLPCNNNCPDPGVGL